MATYFVRKTGSDAYSTAQAQVAATAWLTIDKAANEVAAGDTVVVGAGVYRELVTMDTPGSSGSLITFVADVDGALGSGDPGLVIISAYANELSAATRAACLDPNEKDWIVWRGFAMTGGTSGVVYNNGQNGYAYEGCVLEDCAFAAGHGGADYGVHLSVAAASTPTNNGLIVRRCVFYGGGLHISHSDNESAEVDLKATVDSCLFIGTAVASTNMGGFYFDLATAGGTYHPGGVDVTNCTFVGKYYAVYVDSSTSSTYPVTVKNCDFVYCRYGLSEQTSDTGAVVSAYNTFAATFTAYTNVTAGTGDRDNTVDPGLYGGVGDYPLHRFWGWSPFAPWEPVRLQDDAYVHAVIGDGDTSTAPAFDLYDNPRPMGGRAGERIDLYYVDGSDVSARDNDASWTDDGNAFDGDTATIASTTTPGTVSTDELYAQGTNAPSTGGAITDVEGRVYLGDTTGDSLWVRLYTNADLLLSTGYTGDNAWSAWATASTPSGGWTWAKVQEIEAYIYLSASGTLGEIGVIELKVISEPYHHDDRGAVEGRARPEVETTTVDSGTSVRFEGAGFHDFLIPVAAASTTVTVKALFDASYTGTLPQLLLMNGPGLPEGTPDVVTEAADTWDTLSINFTPTLAGIARVRIRSNDTSATGECFFDTLAVT